MHLDSHSVHTGICEAIDDHVVNIEIGVQRIEVLSHDAGPPFGKDALDAQAEAEEVTDVAGQKRARLARDVQPGGATTSGTWQARPYKDVIVLWAEGQALSYSTLIAAIRDI